MLARGILALVAAGLMLSCSHAWASDLDEIKRRQAIRVALPVADAPPFVVTQPDGSVRGLEGELVRDLARRMDVRIEFVRTAQNGDELIAQVVDDRADLAIGQLADSLEWAKSVRFSTPYLTLYQTRLFDRLAVTRAGGIEALLARSDARLAVRAGSVALPLLREELGADRLVTFPSIETALAQAQANNVVGVVGDDVEISRWLEDHADAAIRWEIQLRRDRPLTIAMAVGWNAENLQAWLNLYLAKCSRDQTLAKLWVKHLGEARMRGEQ